MLYLQRAAKSYTTDVSFDPSNLIGNDKLGIGPANTTLTITTREILDTVQTQQSAQLHYLLSPIYEFNDPTIANTLPSC